MKFESKRLQFTAQWPTPAFAFIATFIAISNSLGFERALYLAVIVALFGWIIANQLVHGTPLVQPQPTTALPSTPGGYPIGCSNCSSAMSFHPPDSRHIVLLMNPCDQGDSLEVKRKCAACGKENIRYWDNIHPQMGFARV